MKSPDEIKKSIILGQLFERSRIFTGGIWEKRDPGSFLGANYYPFGLTMAGISDKAIKTQYAENKYRFNSGNELQNKEFSDGSGLEMYDANFRGYDPQLGRFWQIDPLADINEDWSPYSFASDNPILYNDPLGLADSPSVVPAPIPQPKPVCIKCTLPKGDPAKTFGPPPSHVPDPIPDPRHYDQIDKSTFGYNTHDPEQVIEHTVVQESTIWERLGNTFSGNGPLLGYNKFGDKVYDTHVYHYGTPPDIGLGGIGEGFGALFKLRNAREWESLFEWGHKWTILEKLKTVSVLDVERLKKAGVTIEQMKLWAGAYGKAMVQERGTYNVIAHYRLEFINKLISLW